MAQEKICVLCLSRIATRSTFAKRFSSTSSALVRPAYTGKSLPPSKRERRQRDDAPTTQTSSGRRSQAGKATAVKRIDLKPIALSRELQYLKDPVKLGDHVRYLLKQGDEEKAIALSTLSSRAKANIVSWNHVMEYQLQQGKTKAAWQTYNDVSFRPTRAGSATMLTGATGQEARRQAQHSDIYDSAQRIGRQRAQQIQPASRSVPVSQHIRAQNRCLCDHTSHQRRSRRMCQSGRLGFIMGHPTAYP